jgi:hypothetical protein
MEAEKSCIEQLNDWLCLQRAAGLVDFKEFFEPESDCSPEERARDMLDLLTSDQRVVVFKA